ncbi:hypothetical protein [Actinophytocola sp.]|uniref:hypothetical protein n=1 Tax=Actinophytocola sp. TaxID=1872138 RepID=UPI002D7ED7A0|nr:hypothetical protein [Actinophytocola sp.]HET9142108.1 hypothetical protein [Actinophytocola sp.]
MARADGFSVDLGALAAARAGVGDLLSGLDGARVGEPAGEVGHPGLAEAVAEFRDRWAEGIRELSAAVSAIHRQLGETIEEYRRSDQQAARALDRLLDGGHGG